MSDLAFPPELRTASIVTRWSIVWTLNKDYVTNHSFFVMMYAVEIAYLLGWDWKGPRLGVLMYLAATHDLNEIISGDIVSPVKCEILDQDRAAAYFDLKLNERLPRIMRHLAEFPDKDWVLDCWPVISAADRLDALLFLITEQRLGNTVIGPRVPDIQDRLEAAWYELPAERGKLQELWNTQVMPSITAHRGQGGFGI